MDDELAVLARAAVAYGDAYRLWSKQGKPAKEGIPSYEALPKVSVALNKAAKKFAKAVRDGAFVVD